MTKRMLLKIETCRNCPFVRMTQVWFARCTHPIFENEKRISRPELGGNQELKIPDWCPLDEMENEDEMA